MASVWDSTSSLTLLNRIELLTHEISHYRSTHIPSDCESSKDLKEKQYMLEVMITALEEQLITSGLGNLPISPTSIPSFMVGSHPISSPDSHHIGDYSVPQPAPQHSVDPYEQQPHQHQSSPLYSSQTKIDQNYVRLLSDLVLLPPSQLAHSPTQSSLFYYNNVQRSALDTGDAEPQPPVQPDTSEYNADEAVAVAALIASSGVTEANIMPSLVESLDSDIQLQQQQQQPLHFEQALADATQSLESELIDLHKNKYNLRDKRLSYLEDTYQGL